MAEFKLLLDDDEIEKIKIIAAKRKVRPQVIARNWVRGGLKAIKWDKGQPLLPPANVNSEELMVQPDSVVLRDTVQSVYAIVEQAKGIVQALEAIGRGLDGALIHARPAIPDLDPIEEGDIALEAAGDPSQDLPVIRSRTGNPRRTSRRIKRNTDPGEATG